MLVHLLEPVDSLSCPFVTEFRPIRPSNDKKADACALHLMDLIYSVLI